MDASPELLAVVRDRASRPEPVCLFAYDLVGLRRHVERTVAALPSRCSMYYAMKANSAGAILRCLAPLVAGFEVASGGEIEKVRAVSADAADPRRWAGQDPVRAGRRPQGGRHPHPRRERPGAVPDLGGGHARSGSTVEVALRVNLAGPFPDATLAMAGRPTQFGISEDDLPAAVEAATTLPGLRFAGFHLHSLSNNLSAATHLAMLEVYRDTVLAWERRFGVHVEVLDVGGGIGIDYGRPETPFDWDGFCGGLADWVATLPGALARDPVRVRPVPDRGVRALRRRGARREVQPRRRVRPGPGRDAPLPAAGVMAAQPSVHGPARRALGLRRAAPGDP